MACHRVVGKRGRLTGFGGAIDTEIKLLGVEIFDMSKVYVPTQRTYP
ncbi:hypothetical protein [Staphylococcus aureus]